MKHNQLFKRLPAFAAGMMAMAMLAALAEPVSAAGEKIACNQVGIRVMREEQVKAGEAWTASNGQKVPSTITYTDAAGGKTNYIAVPRLSELLDADISWDEDTGSVDIGVSPVPGEVTVAGGVSSNDSQEPARPNQPEYGKVIGNLEEIDPKTVPDVVAANPNVYPGGVMYACNTRMQDPYGNFPEITIHPRTGKGEYLVYTVTNHGQTAKEVTVKRPVSVTLGRWERFPTLNVEPGKTLVRVFRVLKDEDTHPMQRTFTFGVRGMDFSIRPQERPMADVAVSLVQYRG